jgi:hypothetical protein
MSDASGTDPVPETQPASQASGQPEADEARRQQADEEARKQLDERNRRHAEEAHQNYLDSVKAIEEAKDHEDVEVVRRSVQ